MEGIVIKYSNKNINTDLIIPARYLVQENPDILATHCMEDLDPEFSKRIKEYHYSIIVADSNFGCGSSREQAPIAIKASGIKCVIAPSFARIFFRNSINMGLQIIETGKIDDLNTGDKLQIDSSKGEIHNLSNDQRFYIKKQPKFLQEIISANGLVNYAKKILEK
jgi:3-isopropylmalate/(R)-2-methylmalate dehydratase small subunit